MKAGASILLVDDDPDFRLLLRETLEALGYRIHEAGDGREALTVMENEEPDLAIVDIDMPRMNGIEFTKKVKAISPQFPVMMITGYAQLYSPGEIVSTGMDAFLQKPIDLNQVASVIERL
jgi:CheY-like chemotaxis protein